MDRAPHKRMLKEEIYTAHLTKAFYPFKLLLSLLMAALSIVFFALSIAFVYSWAQSGKPDMSLPAIFHANTLILLVSSITIHQTIHALKQGDYAEYRIMLFSTITLGAGFIFFQYLGLKELLNQGYIFSSSQSGSYLYLVSALHALHVIVGLAVLGFMWARSLFVNRDPVKMLLFSADASQPYKAGLISTYWHFIGGIWIYLYVLFIILT